MRLTLHHLKVTEAKLALFFEISKRIINNLS